MTSRAQVAHKSAHRLHKSDMCKLCTPPSFTHPPSVTCALVAACTCGAHVEEMTTSENRSSPAKACLARTLWGWRADRTITGRNVRYRKLRPEALERPESGANPRDVETALWPTFQDDRLRSQAILGPRL